MLLWLQLEWMWTILLWTLSIFTKMVHKQSFWGLIASFQPLTAAAGSKYRFLKIWSSTSAGQSWFLLPAADLTLLQGVKDKSASQIWHLVQSIFRSKFEGANLSLYLLVCTHSTCPKFKLFSYFKNCSFCTSNTIHSVCQSHNLKSKIPIYRPVQFKMDISTLIKESVYCIAFLHPFISSVYWSFDSTVLFGQKYPCITFQDKKKDYRNQRDKWANINRMARKVTELSIQHGE